MTSKVLDFSQFGLQLEQNQEEMKISIDTFLLSSFVMLKKIQNKILDLGTNNGAIALILSHFYPQKQFLGIDVNENAISLANSNATNNNVKNCTFKVIDFFDLDENNKFDVIVSNPPYYNGDKTNMTPDTNVHVAKYDDMLPLDKLFKKATKVLEPKGEIHLIYLAEAFTQIIGYAEKEQLMVKEVQFIHFTKDKNAKLVMLKIKKNAMAGIVIKPPLILEDGQRTLDDYVEIVLRSKENV